MIFGQIRGAPWYGKNAGRMQGLTTSPHHIKLTGRHLLSVPRPIAAQLHTCTAFGWRNKPQRARRGHDQAKRVGAHEALPLATLILAPTVAGAGITERNFHRPAVAVLAQDVVSAQGEIGAEKCFDRWGWFALPSLFGAAFDITPDHHDADEL